MFKTFLCSRFDSNGVEVSGERIRTISWELAERLAASRCPSEVVYGELVDDVVCDSEVEDLFYSS